MAKLSELLTDPDPMTWPNIRRISWPKERYVTPISAIEIETARLRLPFGPGMPFYAPGYLLQASHTKQEYRCRDSENIDWEIYNETL